MSDRIKTIRTGRGSQTYTVRFPLGLVDRIKSHAANNNRSFNSEVISALEETYPAPVVPLDVNEAVLDAAKGILEDWSRMISAMGQDPDENGRLKALTAALDRASQRESQ